MTGKAPLTQKKLASGPASANQLLPDRSSIDRNPSIPMFKRLEEEFNQKESMTQLEAHKKALQKVRDLKRSVDSTEIQEHAISY